MRIQWYGPNKGFLFELNITTRRWQFRLASHQVFAIYHPSGVEASPSSGWRCVFQWLNPRHYRGYDWVGEPPKTWTFWKHVPGFSEHAA